MILKLSTYLANKISGQVFLSQRDQAALRFGFEVLFGEGIKLVVFLGVAYFLGVTQEVFIIAMISALLRMISGGVHCSTYSHCLLFSATRFNIMGLAVRWLASNLPHICLLGIVLSAFMVAWWVVDCWVPADNPNRPITDLSEKIKFKKISFYFINIWLISMTAVWGIGFYYSDSGRIIIAATMGILWQIFSVTPWGYRMVNALDKSLGYIKFTHKGGGTYEKI